MQGEKSFLNSLVQLTLPRMAFQMLWLQSSQLGGEGGVNSITGRIKGGHYLL